MHNAIDEALVGFWVRRAASLQGPSLRRLKSRSYIGLLNVTAAVSFRWQYLYLNKVSRLTHNSLIRLQLERRQVVCTSRGDDQYLR